MLRGISRDKYIEFFELIILLKCSIELKLHLIPMMAKIKNF